MKKTIIVVTMVTALFGVHCNLFGPEDGGETRRMPVGTQFIGTFGAAAQAKRLRSASVHDTGYQAPHTDNPCSRLITPRNVSGKLIQLNLKVGGDDSRYVIQVITPFKEGFHARSVSSTDEFLVPFDLADPLEDYRTELVHSPRDPYPGDDNCDITQVQLTYAWMDFQFSTINSGLPLDEEYDGVHTIRVAFADVADRGYVRGDILYLDTTDLTEGAQGTFKWIDEDKMEHHGESVLVSTRPANPIVYEDVATFDGWGEGGNSSVPPFIVDIHHDERQAMPFDTYVTHSWEFDIIFNMEKGIWINWPDGCHRGGLKTLVKNFNWHYSFQAFVEATGTPLAEGETIISDTTGTEGKG
jgi:hypothetical protein